MKGFVKISTEELLRVCKQCAENFHNYDQEKDGKKYITSSFSFHKMKRVYKTEYIQ